MASSTLEVADRLCAIGMSWSLHPTKASLKAALKEAGRRVLHVQRKTDDGLLLGIADDISPRRSIVPAALVLTEVTGEVIVYHDVPDDAVWLCILVDGVPLPGMDIVLPLHEARIRVSELMSSHPSAVLVGSFPGSVSTVEEVFSAADRKALDRLRLERSGVSPAAIGAMVALPFLLGGGALLPSQAMQRSETLRLATQQAQTAFEAQARQGATDEQLRQEFHSRVDMARQSLRAGVPALAQYEQWRQAVMNLPASHEGYILTGAKCEVLDRASRCALTWDAPGGARSPDLTAALTVPGVPSADLNSNPGDLASGTTSALNLPTLEPVDFSAVHADVRLRLISQLARHGLAMKLVNQTDVVVSPDPRLAKESKPVVVGMKGTWQADLPSLAHADAFAEDTQGANLILRAIRITGIATGHLRLFAEGDYVFVVSTDAR
jgi:hypothetical protein